MDQVTLWLQVAESALRLLEQVRQWLTTKGGMTDEEFEALVERQRTALRGSHWTRRKKEVKGK